MLMTHSNVEMRKTLLAGHAICISGYAIYVQCAIYDAVRCKDYTASLTEEFVSMEHWWNDTDSGNWSIRDKHSHCHFIITAK